MLLPALWVKVPHSTFLQKLDRKQGSSSAKLCAIAGRKTFSTETAAVLTPRFPITAIASCSFSKLEAERPPAPWLLGHFYQNEAWLDEGRGGQRPLPSQLFAVHQQPGHTKRCPEGQAGPCSRQTVLCKWNRCRGTGGALPAPWGEGSTRFRTQEPTPESSLPWAFPPTVTSRGPQSRFSFLKETLQ